MKNMFTPKRRARIPQSGTYQKLANEAATEGLLGMANELSAGDWICLSPIGDFPHARGMQRVDAAAVSAMANQFNSALAKVGRALFGGVPFYVGHPDVPGMANEFPDRKAYGWVKALEARADGLHGQIEWSEPGKTLLANKHYKYFSPYWDARTVGTEKGKTVYQPTALLSVGLTNQPNLPVKPLANAKDNMNKELRDALCQRLKLANTATDEEIGSAITALQASVNTLGNERTQLSNDLQTAKTAQTAAHTAEVTKHAETKTRLENVMVQRNKLALDLAVKEGRIAPAEREEWTTKLANDYDANAKVMAEKKPTLKTSTMAGLGERRTTLANVGDVQERSRKVQTLVQKEMKDVGCDYSTAYQNVRMANAALFEEMHDSLKQD